MNIKNLCHFEQIGMDYNLLLPYLPQVYITLRHVPPDIV
jgi:hypothetical protein